MLHMLGQSQLARSLFPVGGMPKAETRAHAARFGLPVATKPDSQELCFAPSGDAGGFVRSAVPSSSGPVARSSTPTAGVVGEHDGTFAFTVGQRRGLGVALGRKAYVVDVDARSEPGDGRGRRSSCLAGAWWPTVCRGWPAMLPPRGRSRPGCASAIGGRRPGRDRPVARAGSRPRSASRSGRSRPGQSAVVYRGDELLGGGRIVSSFR